MNKTHKQDLSVFRLRLGIFFFFLWWFPIWIIVPIVQDFTDFRLRVIFVSVAALQSILGILGVFLAGKEVVKVVKDNKLKAGIKTIWHIFISGSY